MPNPLAVIEEELADLESREATLLAEAEKGNIDPFRSELDELNDQITARREDKVRVERAQKRDRTAPTATAGEPGAERTEPQTLEELYAQTRPVNRASIGAQFLASDEWQAFKKHVAPSGNFSDRKQFGTSPAVPVPGLLRSRPGATLITGLSDTQAGAFVTNDVYPGLYPQGLQRPLTIRDVVTNGSTDSDTVEFVQMTGQTNAAAPVAEATATGGASGTKPESAIALAKVTTTVKTIAHWIPATKRALADAGQLRTLIDAFLRYGLEEELEDQMMNGDGTGENFTGIANTSGIQAQAWDTDILTTTRKARTKVRTVGRAIPTAYILHPTDWEIIDLLQDNEARFYGAGPFGLSPSRLWGLPVVESEGQTAGQGHVGDFRKCVLWDREQASINVSDSHSDFFIRNLVAILAEMRAAFGCVQPNAIVEIDLTA
jgi:HK97 family phage major capsid protein